MNEPNLLVAIDGTILRLTINRPERRNALSLALLDNIGAALASHAANPQLHCAVLTGAGDKCFAAGGDLQKFDAIRTSEATMAMSRRGRHALQCVRDFPVPVVCALNGHALGGGAELALACDLRVAIAGAEIGFLQSTLSVTTAWGGGIDLAATVGDRRALDLLVSGRRVGTAEALSLGLVSQVAKDAESLSSVVDALAATLAVRSRPVLEGVKALTTAARRALHHQLMATEEQHFVATWTHDDHWRAVAAATRRSD